MSKPVNLSYSSISRYKQCPEKYRLSKHYKSKIEGSSLAFGKALDLAIEYMLQNLDADNILESSKVIFKNYWHTLPADDFDDERQVYATDRYTYYRSDYDKSCLMDEETEELIQEDLDLEDPDKSYKAIDKKIKNNEKLTDEEQEIYNLLSWYSLRLKGLLMLEAFWRDFVPGIEEVLETQGKLIIENEEGDKKRGALDGVTIHNLDGVDKPVTVVWDWKTAGRPYSQHQLDTSEQLIGYRQGRPDLKTDYVGYVVLLKQLKKHTTCSNCGHVRTNYRKIKCEECKQGRYDEVELYADSQILVKKVEDEEMESLAEDDSQVLTAIKNDIFFKNPASCHLFNRECEYYSICWRNADPDELDHLESRSKKK